MKQLGYAVAAFGRALIIAVSAVIFVTGFGLFDVTPFLFKLARCAAIAALYTLYEYLSPRQTDWGIGSK